MKITNSINHSLSRKVLALMGLCFIFFALGCGLLFYFQQNAHDDYVHQRSIIKEKQLLIYNIYDYFNTDLLIMPESIAFKVPDSIEEARNTESLTKQHLTELHQMIDTHDERIIYQEIDNFITYYFNNLIPLIMDEYEETQDPSVDFQNISISLRAEEFLEQNKLYMSVLEEQLTKIADEFSQKQLNIQNSVIVFFALILILSIFVIRKILSSIGKPLANFTFAADEIAAGRDAVIEIDNNRKDELGVLSVAFKKMMDSVQDKEQNLVAHNEELIAQQEELQAQQEELRHALETLTDNEQKLLRWNQLINRISTSLDKSEVVNSIIENLCKITKSDKGIIFSLLKDEFASYGVSKSGVIQFRDHIDNGFTQRLRNEKTSFTVKRLQHPAEKGFHENVNYSFDMYLPIISDNEVAGILVLSRYGGDYTEKELQEFDTYVKQITIYLEKVELFEQSESDRRLSQDILNTVQEGIQLIGTERDIIQVNQHLNELFKWHKRPEEMIGLPWEHWSQFMAGAVQEHEFIHSLENMIQSAYLLPEEEHSFIYKIKDSNQVIKVYCRTIEYYNEHIGTLLVHRDITKEYEIGEMKSELVSTVSHELRTPLASILGFTELLITKELKPERKTKYLQTIYNESKRLTSLINDFLDIQRMESKKQTYEKKFIDISTIIQNVIELQEVNTSLHKITLSIELEETMILGDKHKLQQVFMNLLSNAIKYSPDGGNILIRIYGNQQKVSIDVKDEGLGIPQDAIPNLFQQFYRVDNSDRRKIGGTGLGLAIVQEIIKAHEGTITVSSEYGVGSTFTTQFPRTALKVIKENTNDISHLNNYRIMVIEDDLSLAELLSQELRGNGFYVDYQNSGKKALEQLIISPPDAVVLDIMLADEIDGWTIMKEMKRTEKLKNIPIFVSTALDDKEFGFSLGAEDYLIKPYKPSQLTKLIKNTLLTNEKNGQILVPR